jgi:serine/threonine protein kinase
MPAPVNAAEFLDLVKRSGVVDETKLKDYVQRLTERSAIPSELPKLAGLLVRDAILTYFQAEQILQGKYKRFTIGKYKVLEKLGAGGMGQVFLCEHKLMRRRVAVKVLPTAKAEDRASLDRFYREARAVAAVDHPNIVRAYDIDQDENLHFLVMEYVDGTNLQDLIKKFGPLDPVRACHYVYGASVGLQHAHEIGLIHRDIKPGNILIDRAGVVKILDMGLARFFHDEEDNLTRQNDENVLGTADYLAPEQAVDSHTVDIRADIYSLGATFYFLLTGSPPFAEGSVAQKLIWLQNKQPKHIRSLRQDVPDEIVAIVERMMMKDPAKRFQTPADVMASLSRWVATPIPPPSEREIPNLSPAAGGSRAPATMVGAYRGSGQGDAPTMIAPEPAPIMTPPPVNPLDVNTPSPVVWETLDNDTQTLSRSDTDRPAHERPQRPSRTARPQRPIRSSPQEPARPKRSWAYVAAAAGAIALIAGIYLAFFHKSGKPVDSGGPTIAAKRIVVSRAGGENAVATLREALSKAGPGDTISIVDSKVAEGILSLRRDQHKDLTIESATADGKPAVIEAGGISSVMLDINDVEGLKLRNVLFDGHGIADTGVQINGRAPGLAIEGVTVRGVKTAAFKLSNAAGETGRPIVLTGCRALLTSPSQTGVWVHAANVETRRTTIQGLRVEGNGHGVGVRIEGASSELEIAGGRFFKLGTAFSFEDPPIKTVARARVASNTIYDCDVGLRFNLPAPRPAAPEGPIEPTSGTYDVTVERNYFAKTRAIAARGPVPVAGLTIRDNAHGEDSAQGNFPIDVWTLNLPRLASHDPDHPDFLRFPGGPPAIPPMNVKVGAP